ncbi:MAG: phosphate ABC transporter permease PstA [Chloroflexi bacterium]|nr:phosphate ABC transporter permease PstA [Chloroflexota bacterium]
MIAASHLSRSRRRRRVVDTVAAGAIIAAGIGVIVPLLAILLFLAVKGLPALSIDLVTKSPGPAGVPGGGVKNAIAGTFVLLGLTLALGLPPAIATGIYLAEYGRGRLGFVIRFLVDVLAGVPSITIGIFVYTAVVLNMGTINKVLGGNQRFTALAGAIALALIMLPVVARVTEEMLLLVPQMTREASYALGVPKWRTILTVVLPAASSGILTGVVLASARVAGEAAPLLFTALGNNFYSTGILRPIDALPLRIFTYATGPFAYQHEQAWASSLILVGLVLILSIGSRFLLSRRTR